MKVFIPLSDVLIEEHPELLDGPCIPYPAHPPGRRPVRRRAHALDDWAEAAEVEPR